MSGRIEELYAQWKHRPDVNTTLALCEELRGTARHDLVQAIGAFATREYGSNAAALVAAGRMYMEADRLDEAQSALIAAGKVAPRDAGVYRWLGEVLLRRGDATRAEKVLERAMQPGANDGETQMLLERARVYIPMQARSGPKIVAAEVMRSVQRAQRALSSLIDDDEDKPTLARDVPPELRPHIEEMRETQSAEMRRRDMLGGA